MDMYAGVMKFHFLPILAFTLLFATAARNGDEIQPGSSYWRSMLPNTPLPKPLQTLLQPSGVAQNFSYSEADADTDQLKAYQVTYRPEKENFNTKNGIPNTTTLFCLMGDLLPNKKMRLKFTKCESGSNFSPRGVPFSSNKFQEILKHFSIKPESKEAQRIKQTIKLCKSPNMKGEDKYCVTSLESLVDLAISKFGNNLWALSNEVPHENKYQNYTILKGIKAMGDKQMVCHKMVYPYAVFYCHVLVSTKIYMVPLLGSDGSKVKAVVVCHFDTSAWSPKHLAFLVLHVKPGGPPICHFIDDDTIVWVPK